MSDTPPPPPPGWYDHDGSRRWWDGAAWNDAAAPAEPATPPASTASAAGQKAGKGCGIGCLVVVAIFIAIAAWVGISAASFGNSTEGRIASDRVSAQVACEDAVRNGLKAPSTASFSEQEVTGSGPYTVTGKVDAENSFGAKVRASYRCSTKGTGDDLVAYLEALDQQ